jgi:plasmid stability protein
MTIRFDVLETAVNSETVRSTFYLESALHQALRLKAAAAHRSMSDIVNEAIREALREDQEDLTTGSTRSRTHLGLRAIPDPAQDRWHAMS